jgi:hypothetical protein
MGEAAQDSHSREALEFDIPVFFRAPPGGAGNFSLLGQREVTKRKATPRTRPEHIHVLRIREWPPGFAEGTSLCLRRTGPHPAGHPSDFSVVRSPCSRGPAVRFLRTSRFEAGTLDARFRRARVAATAAINAIAQSARRLIPAPAASILLTSPAFAGRSNTTPESKWQPNPKNP